ncbi:hypothetical protein TTHERM_00105020 (macronuclear) [Tetrahymena thermophila SB210]|uniref:Uncharacterized protein n=1 Tax=Tetrahymena thermophila (strain SB210) TaxID=312017 RepID=Q234J4_TETTS|nr:hypothetical protein TTHERM_00105020 [Tetrahymena thermophila SB210]EAR92009.2 hypothetical protein TTHERM_00105020 [Tetrahymena thermophila SB210]|eukprot:XP_001012254.2 hypothetical protein TTHERM_00105020 [Tetrahymena thermophila SB210]
MIYDNFEVQKPKRSSSCYDKQTSSQNNIAKIPYQNQNENFDNEEEDEQIQDNAQYQHSLKNQQTKNDAVEGKYPVGRYDMAQYQDSMSSSNQDVNRQGDEANAYDEELYSEIDGERIEKSGNTYNDYIDQEILFDEDQVNFQLGVRSNYSSNNTNNNFNSQNQQGNNHNQAQSHHTSTKQYQNYDKYGGEDYSSGYKKNYDSRNQNKEEIGSTNAIVGSSTSVKRQRNANNDLAQQYLMRQFYNQSANSCTICLSKISLAKIVQEQLHDKYYELFNFYFAKGINEILANVNTSHVILFKDYLYMDDSSEYLKRYYQYHEYFPRFSLLADFYTHQYKETRPNLCIISQARIINKRNYKQAKLFITNQERAYRMNEQNQNQGNYNDEINFQDNVVQDDQKVLQHSVIGQNADEQQPISNFLNELDTNFDGVSAEENLNNQSGFIKQANGHPRHHQNILHQDQNMNQMQYQEGSFMDEYNRFEKENSFESKSHDIYYPSYSSDNQSQSSINKDPLNLLKNLTKSQKADNNDSLSHTNYILELKTNFNDDIFIKNPNIRLRGNFISIQSRSNSNIHTNHKNSNIKINNNHINSIQIQDKTNQISTSGQLTPKYNNYFYNELQDLESEMPSYLKVYLEEGQNINSFSQQHHSGNVSSQLSPINQQQANQIKFNQTQQLQQQINNLQLQHSQGINSHDDKKIQLNQQQNYQNSLNLLSSVSGHYMGQGIQPVTPQSNQTSKNYQNQSDSNSQIMKDNRFKIPTTAQQIGINDVEQWKQPPLSARNHAEITEEIRKKKNLNPKGIVIAPDQVSYSKAVQNSTPRQLVQQLNDLTSNSSSNQNEKIQQNASQSPQFQGNIKLQNSANTNYTNKNIIDQNFNHDQAVSVSTPRDPQAKPQAQLQQQQQKQVNKNNNLRPNKTPLQVETKPENNYDYLLKENHLSGGITGPSLKQNAHQQQNQQFTQQFQQQNQQQQQMLQQQQISQQASQQQSKQNSLLNRIPQNVKQQLALNFNDNELLQKNLKINQIQQSPDRIWTDRDVNPRLAANPQKERPNQQNTVVIGKGEVKHLKGGKVLNRPLSNNNELMGSLSDRIFLNKIQEEDGKNHHLPQDYNKFISEQHKELSQKIIQNALNNQMNKISSSSSSNIQEIYRKYQQAREESHQYQNFYNSNNLNSQDQTSVKGSGEHLSFIKAIQQKHDDQSNDILSKLYAMHSNVNVQNDQKDDYHSNNNNLTNHIKQQLNKQKQQQSSQIYDETISKIHKSKINQLIQKATPNNNQASQKKGGATANSSNNNVNSNINNIININNNINIIAKHSINNSSSQHSNYTQNNQYVANQQVNSQQQRKQNKKSPPHSNYSNLNSYNNQLNQQTTQSSNNNQIQVSSGSSNTNQTNFHNSQLYQHLQQQNADLYNNSIGTISNQAVSKLQQEIKQNACTPNRMAHKDQQVHNNNQLKQARTSSLIKNLSGDHETFNESNYKVQKQQKLNQAAIIVPTAQHMLQQYQADQMQHSNQVVSSTQNNQQSKSPISSTVSTCKNVNQKQLSYTSMHNHLQNQQNPNSKAGKITPNSTVSNSNMNQNGKVFFKSINASGNTSSQALKTGNQTNTNSIIQSNNNNNNNININSILTNNYISPTNHNQNTVTPLNIMNNYKSTNNTSQKSYQESHQNSMDKNGSSSRQLQHIYSQQQQQQIQQSQKNLSQNQLGSNINQNSINANNSTLNQNNIINFDINSQLSRTMMSNTNRGGTAQGFNEVNSFNNNNETTLNQKSLIQPGSSHSTTGITNSNNNMLVQSNTPINGAAQSIIQANLNQKISSPNHKKKQKSESLSKSNQKTNKNSQGQQIQNQNIQFISNELSGGISSQSPINVNQNQQLQQQQQNHLNQNGLQILSFEQTHQGSSVQNKQILPSPSSYGQSQQNSIIPQQKKQEFKLNISKIINQQHEFNSSGNKNIYSSSSTTNMNSQNMNHLMMYNNQEENQENSYGFWTSRSNKQNYQHSSQLQQYASQHGSSSTSKYSSSNPKQANLTERKLIKTNNNSKQRKEVPAVNLTDRNQYHRSQQYTASQQKHDNQKPSPQNRKNTAQKNQNSKNIDSHFINQNSLTGKEKINFMSGSGSLSGFSLKK